MRSAVLAVLVVTLASASGAEEPLTVAAQRVLETPAHQALMMRVAAEDHTPGPFVGDGCSGGLSFAWRTIADYAPAFARAHNDTPPFEACCDAHDRTYHAAGGAREATASFDARLQADEALRACVVDVGAIRAPDVAERYGVTDREVAAAYDAIAGAMFQAVRLGGGPCSGLPWRWGFGFGACLAVGVP